MNLTPAQIFQIGGILIGLVTALAPLFGLDAQTVATAGGAVAGAWAAIGVALTGQAAQVASVTNNIEQPAVKTALVQAVANLPGVDQVKTNAMADDALKAVVADKYQPKVK